MAVPKNLPNREIWAKEAINSLPPLAAPQPAPDTVIPTNEERAAEQAEASQARNAKKARHK